MGGNGLPDPWHRRIVVSLVFRLSPLVIAVVLVSLLVLVIAEGNYRVWRETVTEKQDVVTERDVAKCAGAPRRAAT